MHVNKLLQNMFSRSRIILDKRLHRVMLKAAETLSYFKQLSIVGLGRSLQRKANINKGLKSSIDTSLIKIQKIKRVKKISVNRRLDLFVPFQSIIAINHLNNNIFVRLVNMINIQQALGSNPSVSTI